MSTFFRQASDSKFTGSPAFLTAQESTFRNDQASGLIEIQSSAHEQLYEIFTNGLLAGAYRVGPESQQRISVAEISRGWEKPEVPIRTVVLPDTAGRALWLALESKLAGLREVHGAGGWNEFLETCKTGQISGLAEITSENHDGFVFFKDGIPVNSESNFSTLMGFVSSPGNAFSNLTGSLKIRMSELDPASQPYQCVQVRLSVGAWGKYILNRYVDMVGQRLLVSLDNKLNSLILPWQWNIQLAKNEIIDRHFFPKTDMIVHAYRALYISMLVQISDVIGRVLALRILNEAYAQLGAEESRILESRALTPGVFTETEGI
jgi:hypothetical protein